MCNKCSVYVNYLSGEIPINVINEFNNISGLCINHTNIDEFRYNPLLIKLVKKSNYHNCQIKKVFNERSINFNNKLSGLQMLIHLLDEWSNCKCVDSNRHKINVLMNFKFVLKYFEKLSLIPSDQCLKLSKILRSKMHINEQLTKVCETIIELM